MPERNILIVEDMRDWRDQLSDLLNRSGYHVRTASNYGEAMGELRRQAAGVVIVDLRLSASDVDNRDGVKLLEELAQSGTAPIVITGYPTAELAESAFNEYHARGFFHKQDLDIQRLREVIAEAFDEVEGREAARKDLQATEEELAQLREKFLRGEIVRLPEKPVKERTTSDVDDNTQR